ncbi:MAG: SIMPL domain-containing protein [Paracoccaceae bacterium]
MRILPALATAALLYSPVWAEDAKSTISVTGEGHVAVAPDMATVSLGVMTDGDSAKSALDANNAAIAAVLEKLKSAKIEDRDVQTSGLSLGPRYDYSSSNPDGTQKVTGYVASNMVTVRVRALDTVGGVLDAVVTNGANTLNGITFGLADDTAATDAARKGAVEDARRKADLYATAAGVKLGKILSISEQGSYMPPMPMPMAEASFKAGAVPVAGGELGVTATVSVIYELTE